MPRVHGDLGVEGIAHESNDKIVLLENEFHSFSSFKTVNISMLSHAGGEQWVAFIAHVLV